MTQRTDKAFAAMASHESEACPSVAPRVADSLSRKPMSVVIDGIIFALQRHGGISVYFHQLLARLRRDQMSASLILDGSPLQVSPDAGGSVRVVQRNARLAERYRCCRLSNCDVSVFHSSYYRLPDGLGTPSVVTVHDFTYERFNHGPRRWIHSAQKSRAIRAAQAVICVSEATRDDLLEFVGVGSTQKVYVVHNGVAGGFRPEDHPAPDRPFVLFVGQRSGYKNFRLIAEAMTLLPDLELLCVGGGRLNLQELRGLPRNTQRRIRHLGFVDDQNLNRLYNQAVCLVYPSSYEGFGIPVIEAMKAGCPVVCIQCKAVIEVGKAALSVAEPDPIALARKIEDIASSEARAAIVQAGLEVAKSYDWERTYQETLQVYKSVAR